jgi:hypothetical protein
MAARIRAARATMLARVRRDRLVSSHLPELSAWGCGTLGHRSLNCSRAQGPHLEPVREPNTRRRMSSRTTPKNARGLLCRGLKNDAELAKDISALFAFAAVAASSTPPTLVAALGVLLQTSGSVISAALSLTSRFWTQDGQPGDDLPAYERFNALFLLTTIRAYMEALDGVLTEEIQNRTDSDQDRPTKSAHDDDALKTQALEEARIRAKDLHDADLGYLFGVEPLSGEVPLLRSLHSWLSGSLLALGMRPFEASRIADKCDTSARSRFHTILAEDNVEARWMRDFLVLEAQSATQASLSDLNATIAALNGWLTKHEAPATSRDAWNDYRRRLVGLPDLHLTMYSETFGVSQVFQAPVVQYHVAGARGEAGTHHTISDVGKLLGALVSTRTEGQDLIILSGGPGSGKSTLCRVFASQLARSPDAYPIFLQLRRVKEGADIGQFVEDALQRAGLVTRISELLELPNVVLILDGFDELVAANRSRLRQFFNALLDETQTGPLRKAHVIVSGRDTLFPGGQGLPAGSHVVALQPFDRTRVEAWGARWRAQHPTGPGSTFHPEHFLPASEEAAASVASPLEHLVTWPLTLHLVARVYTAGGLPSAAEAGGRIDKAYLYRSILAETSARQADQVGGKGRLEPEAMRAFLRAVAWLMYTRSVDSLDVADVAPLLEGIGGVTDGLDTGLAEVAVLNAPELAKGEETGFEFVHKSFSEFLAAENIAERVERVSFLVREFGSSELAWRMSETEASTALAEVLGIRLLTEEIQEMLEPMLGAVIPFREGTKVEEAVPLAARRSGLEAVLRRCELLYAAGVGGALDLGRVEGVVKDAPGVGSVLEGLANYIVGLALVGCAAAGQLASDEEAPRFNAEPEGGAIWRFIALAHAGGIAIDESLAVRLFRRMTVRRMVAGEEGAEVTDQAVPWKLYLLDGADGYRSTVEPAAERAMLAIRVAMRLVILLVGVLQEQAPRETGLRRLRGRISRRRGRILWSQGGEMRWDDAVTDLTLQLARVGVVSPGLARGWSRGGLPGDHELERVFQNMGEVVERSRLTGEPPRGPLIDWRPVLEQLLSELPMTQTDKDLVGLVAEVLDDRDEWLRMRVEQQ